MLEFSSNKNKFATDESLRNAMGIIVFLPPVVVVQRHMHGTLQCLATIVSLHFVLVIGV